MNLVLRNPTDNAIAVFALKRDVDLHGNGAWPISSSPTIPAGGHLSITTAEAALFGKGINHPLILNDLDSDDERCICDHCLDEAELTEGAETV